MNRLDKVAKIITYYLQSANNNIVVILDFFWGYKEGINKIKVISNKFLKEKDITKYQLLDDAFISDGLRIDDQNLNLFFDDVKLFLTIDNRQVLKCLNKNYHGKNECFFTSSFSSSGKLNDSDISYKGMMSFEYINCFKDYYYKLYILDFNTFLGTLSFLADDEIASNLAFFYKGDAVKERKRISFKEKTGFGGKMHFKLRSFLNYKMLFMPKEAYVEARGLLPFKVKFGTINLLIKKGFFKKKIEAKSKNALLIYYNFSDKNC